jgi:hypothetical protein
VHLAPNHNVFVKLNTGKMQLTPVRCSTRRPRTLDQPRCRLQVQITAVKQGAMSGMQPTNGKHRNTEEACSLRHHPIWLIEMVTTMHAGKSYRTCDEDACLQGAFQ